MINPGTKTHTNSTLAKVSPTRQKGKKQKLELSISQSVNLGSDKEATTTSNQRIIMPSPWHKMTARTPTTVVATSVAHHHHSPPQGLVVPRQQDGHHHNIVAAPRLSKKQLSLSANRESLAELLQEQTEQCKPAESSGAGGGVGARAM